VISSELIFLTATVKVQAGNSQVKLNDTNERIKSIITATNSWMQFAAKTKRDLVLIENSGSMHLLRAHLTKKPNLFVRLIEAPIDTRSINEGISAGEFEMIRLFINNYDIDGYQFIWKISGRNFCPNARKVLLWDRKADIVASRNSLPSHFVNTRLFGMKPEMWREFSHKEVNFYTKGAFGSNKSYSSMEHLVTQFVLDQEVRGKRQTDFPKIPRFTGYSGSTNKIIDSKKRRVLLVLLNPFRRMIIKLLIGMTP